MPILHGLETARTVCPPTNCGNVAMMSARCRTRMTRMACLMTRLMHGKTLLSTKLPAAAARQSNGQWHLTAMGPVWK